MTAQETPVPQKRIATEEAFVTADIMRAGQRVLESVGAEPGFIKMGASILGKGPGTAKPHTLLLELGAGRIAQMDAVGCRSG